MTGTLAHFVALMRADFKEFAQQRLQEIGVSSGVLYFLIYIAKHDGCTAGELAANLHADAGYATRAVSKLVDSGFVERWHNGADKRTVTLHLTEKGKSAFEQARMLFAEWDKKMLVHLRKQQKDELLCIMGQLSQYIDGSKQI